MPTPFLFFPLFPFPFPVIAPPMFHPFSAHASFLLSWKLARSGEAPVSSPQFPAKNGVQLQKLVGNQIHSVPTISKVGEDASHRSHREDVPMTYKFLLFYPTRPITRAVCFALTTSSVEDTRRSLIVLGQVSRVSILQPVWLMNASAYRPLSAFTTQEISDILKRVAARTRRRNESP